MVPNQGELFLKALQVYLMKKEYGSLKYTKLNACLTYINTLVLATSTLHGITLAKLLRENSKFSTSQMVD